MFNRLITRNLFFVRVSRELLRKGGPTGPTSTNSFPYKLGGVQTYPSHSAYIDPFGREKQSQFVAMYGDLLDAIVNKNKSWLNEKVAAQLVQPCLAVEKIRQVNRESQIQMMLYTMGIGIGVQFARNDNEYKTMAEKNNVFIYADMDKGPSTMMNFMKSGVPVLLNFDVGFKSSRKLVTESQESKASQVHLVTFQQESNIEISKMMGLMGNQMNQQTMDKFRKMILGSSNPWKIGNIDKYLKSRYESAK